MFFDAAEVVLLRHAFNGSRRAYVALERAILFELWACFPSASRGFGQDGQVVTEDGAADGRGEILKPAKTTYGQPECPL